MSPFVALLVKVTLLFLAGLTASHLLRRRAAAARHLSWTLTLSGVLLLSVTTPVTPALRVPIPAWGIVATFRATPPASELAFQTGRVAGRKPASNAVSLPAGRGASAVDILSARWLVLAWLAGAAGVAAWCVLGHLGLARIVRRARPLPEEWERLGQIVALAHRIQGPVRILQSAAVGSPLIWGVRRPVVLLPEDAGAWSAERRRVVLAHELAHAARGDALTQLLACLTCALFWFHPLAWMAARRLRLESERACDDLVVAGGVPGAEYAAHLLEVARGAQLLRPGGMVAIGMARPTQLENRLLAVLDAARARSAPTLRARLAAWASLALLVPLLTAISPIPTRAAPVVISRPMVAAPEFQQRPPTEVEATPGGKLRLELETGGNVDIRAWDEPRIRVHTRLAGPNARDTRVSLERKDGVAVLRSWQEVSRPTSSTSHSFEILVPRRQDIRINSAGGSLTIVGISGDFAGETGGGNLTLERASGRAELATGGGDISVTDSELSGSVRTGGGEVRLSAVRGGLRGYSGGGPIITREGGTGRVDDVVVAGDQIRLEQRRTEELRQLEARLQRLRAVGEASLAEARTRQERERAEEIRRMEEELAKVRKEKPPALTAVNERNEASFKPAGLLSIEKAGGPIVMEEAPDGADLSTGGGEIRVGRAAGLVRARTGGGDIRIGPVAGSVTATTGAGQIEVILIDPEGREQAVEVGSGSGPVTLVLPRDFSGRFDLETAYTENHRGPTRITSDWDLEETATDRWDAREGTPRKYVRARGLVGSADASRVIRVRTVNGDIRIRRAER